LTRGENFSRFQRHMNQLTNEHKKRSQLMAKKTSKQTHTGKAVTTHLRPNTKKEIDGLFNGMEAINEVRDGMKTILERDLWNRKDDGTTPITDRLNKIFTGKDDEKIQVAKLWVKRELQTVIKMASLQVEVLGENVDTQNVTIKKVTKPMVENVDNRFEGNFNEVEIGTFKVVIENKNKVDETLEQKLQKWMRSVQLWKKETDEYETETVRMLLDNIDKGLVK